MDRALPVHRDRPPDGDVLIAGGFDPAGDRCRRRNATPDDRCFAPTGGLVAAREPLATLLLDGRVLITVVATAAARRRLASCMTRTGTARGARRMTATSHCDAAVGRRVFIAGGKEAIILRQ
jgi:hypothetical protein